MWYSDISELGAGIKQYPVFQAIISVWSQHSPIVAEMSNANDLPRWMSITGQTLELGINDVSQGTVLPAFENLV